MEEEHVDQSRTQTFLVEHYWPGVTERSFGAAAESLRIASEAVAAAGADLRYLHSTLVPEDEAAFCVFHASSRALVEQVYARAGVRFERILDAVEPGVASSQTKGDSP